MEKLLFSEEQRFRKAWLWILLMGVSAAAVIPVWYAVYIQELSAGAGTAATAGTATVLATALFTTLLMVLILWLFGSARLITEIRKDGIYFMYPPFIRKWRMIKREDIVWYEVAKYRPLIGYGGWGVRQGFGRKKRAYNVYGITGLKLILKDGKSTLIGTQRGKAMEDAMRKLMETNDR